MESNLVEPFDEQGLTAIFDAFDILLFISICFGASNSEFIFSSLNSAIIFLYLSIRAFKLSISLFNFSFIYSKFLFILFKF